VERAIVQPQALQLTEEIFWSAQTKKKQFRVNLESLPRSAAVSAVLGGQIELMALP